jgi:protocatechuate 3,4-dioxygenase beta subunit
MQGGDVIQEFILLSDILGLSLLVDSIDHPKPTGSTEGTVLGPFHTHEAPDIAHGEEMSHDPQGEPLLVVCTVKDTRAQPVAAVKIDVWETDSSGHYDVQHADRPGPDGRCVIRSDQHGKFWFKAIKPVPYPIPHDGPIGQLLRKLHRHAYRPAHVHFMFEKEGYDHLITYVDLFLSQPVYMCACVCGHADHEVQIAFPPQRPVRDLGCRFWREE